ncbi:hypothetical protein [Pseudomonas sp. S2_H01]
MTPKERAEITQAATQGLNRAIRNWNQVGSQMRKAMVLDSISSEAYAVNESVIPGHPFVDEEKPEVDEFVALVVDMRKSSERLKTRASFPGIEDGFQRVYYETSALLPALAQTALHKDGHVTEYLGDGVLILFRVDTDDRPKTIKAAYNAAARCVDISRKIVNDLLFERFKLPSLDIGAGLSLSKAMVTMVGLPGSMQPKAIGQCVWEASKLSAGYNRVNVSEDLKTAWPSVKGGSLKFTRLDSHKYSVPGFEVRKAG